MKVVCSPTIIEKYDANNINEFDIEFMNKLNGGLRANGDLKISPRDNDLRSSGGDDDGGGGGPKTFIVGERRLDALLIGEYGGANEATVGAADDVRRLSEEPQEPGEGSWPDDKSGCGATGDCSPTAAKSAISANASCASDSGLESAASSWDKSMTEEVKELALSKLEEELQDARKVLKLRDEEVGKLRKIRQDVENELLELTASLFQEAHRMVREANMKQSAAEKALNEKKMEVDVLSGEVEALKTLVLTSTPSKPNLHLHCQSREDSPAVLNGTNFFKKHNRSPSHIDLKYGRPESSPSQPSSSEDVSSESHGEFPEMRDDFEVDPNSFREFLIWRENPTLEKDNSFVTHMYREDIDQCLDFNNSVLVAEVKKAIDEENIFIEAVDKAKAHFPKKCALMEMPRLCFYRMKLADSDEWHYISQMCRNRIIAVINFLNYLRYIKRGLVKSSAEDMYWEVVRLRKEMMLAKLGIPVSSHSS